MRILFLDTVGYKPYTLTMAANEALGGTEASVLRVAQMLSEQGHDVSLYVHKYDLLERAPDQDGGIRYMQANDYIPRPDVIIHLRTAEYIEAFKSDFPEARQLVWLHDLGSKHLASMPITDVELIVLCDYHKRQIVDTCRIYGHKPKAIHIVPYWCDYTIKPDVEKVPYRLGWFSSPHKGLLPCIKHFREARARYPDLHMVVANPGYLPGLDLANEPGILLLGELKPADVWTEMARCKALFYPQTVFPEAFGLVMTEAISVGTPVIAHRFGSVPEVLGTGNEIVDGFSSDSIQAALDRMLRDSPQVNLKTEYTKNEAIKRWGALLDQTPILSEKREGKEHTVCAEVSGRDKDKEQ